MSRQYLSGAAKRKRQKELAESEAKRRQTFEDLGWSIQTLTKEGSPEGSVTVEERASSSQSEQQSSCLDSIPSAVRETEEESDSHPQQRTAEESSCPACPGLSFWRSVDL